MSEAAAGYAVRHDAVAIAGVADLQIRSLRDRQQYSDPCGAAERLGIGSALWPLFGLLWPSGRHLARCLGERPVAAGERMLEVGCGLALASLVGHRRGADVTASDAHPLAGAFLRENLRLNGLPPLPYRHGHWAPEPAADAPHVTGPWTPPGEQRVHGHYDLVIGSDLLYERDDEGALAGFIARHSGPRSAVWIVDPDRGNRSAFNRHMVREGFVPDGQQCLNAAATPRLSAYKGRLLAYRRG